MVRERNYTIIQELLTKTLAEAINKRNFKSCLKIIIIDDDDYI